MLATYHNHSRWSDGKATLDELLAAAQGMGIGELGISDHWVLHPQAVQQRWAMPTDKLGEYVAAMLELRERARLQAATVVRIGLEVDWFPGYASQLREALSKHPFDYLIGSVHEVDGFKVDMSPTAWANLSEDERNEQHRRYWRHMKSLGESGVFDIVAHIDLPKKFGFFPTADLSREIGEALDAIAAARNSTGGPLVVELNTAGWHKPCDDCYPSLEILQECRLRDIAVTINADAHQPEHLLRDFDRAAERLMQAGYTQLARFAERRVRFERLSN